MRTQRSVGRRLGAALGGIALLAGLGVGTTTAGAQTLDAGILHQQQIDALHAGNVLAVMATFADDAVYEGTGLCAPSACIGKPAIQREIERQVADRMQIADVNRQVTGGFSTGIAHVRSNQVRAAGIERIVTKDTLEVRNGRFAAIHVTLDLSDPQTVDYLQRQGSASVAPTPIPAANTSAAAYRALTPIPPANTFLSRTPTPIPAANTLAPRTSVAALIQSGPILPSAPASNAAPRTPVVRLPNTGNADMPQQAPSGWSGGAVLLGIAALTGLALVRRRRA